MRRRSPLVGLTCLLLACAAHANAQPQPPPEIRRVAVLPFLPADESARWAGYALADSVARALATNVLVDAPSAPQIAGAYRALGASLLASAIESPGRAARALGVDLVVHGWVRWENDSLIADIELLDVTIGARLVAQTFRTAGEDPLGPGAPIASRVCVELFGAPLMSAASEASNPASVPVAALESYGAGLAALDEASGTPDAEPRLGALQSACAQLVAAANLSPGFGWPYQPLLRASTSLLLADPTSAAACADVAVAKRALGDLRGAADVLRDGLDRMPQSAALATALADVLLDLAATEGVDRPSLLREAVATADRATVQEPGQPAGWVLLGAAAFDSGDYARAATAYSRAAALRPGDAIAELGLGLSLVRMGRWEEGKAHLQLVTHLDGGGLAERAHKELERLGL